MSYRSIASKVASGHESIIKLSAQQRPHDRPSLRYLTELSAQPSPLNSHDESPIELAAAAADVFV
jgi:hypothetical protein